jgi:hypothetical protein
MHRLEDMGLLSPYEPQFGTGKERKGKEEGEKLDSNSNLCSLIRARERPGAV